MADDKKTEKVAEKPTVKPEKSELAKAVQETLNEILPALVGALGASHTPAAAAPAPAAPLADHSTCPECRQMKVACGGRHRKVVVLPTDEDAAQWFQGIKINGVNYLSSHLGHAVTVPEGAPIESMMQTWVQNERELVRGRKRGRHSGSVGPQGTAVSPLGPKDFFR